MGSLALDCQPTQHCTRDNTGPSPALAPARTPEPSLASPANHGGVGHHTSNSHPRPASKQRVFMYHGLLYGGEVVGRKCSVLQVKSQRSVWQKGHVAEYDPCSRRHRLVFGKSSSKEQQQGEWVNLSEMRFKWESDPVPKAAPNPTFSADQPSKDAAIGKKLKVYWPAMSRWYTGVVKAYDARSDKHSIQYKDGDSQELVLKHEPVLWADSDDSFRSYEEQASDQQHKAQAAASGSQQRESSRLANGSRSTGKQEASTAHGARNGSKQEQARLRRHSEPSNVQAGVSVAVPPGDGARSDGCTTDASATAQGTEGGALQGTAGIVKLEAHDLLSGSNGNGLPPAQATLANGNGVHQPNGKTRAAAGALGKHAREVTQQPLAEAGQKRLRRSVTQGQAAQAKPARQPKIKQPSPAGSRQQSPASTDPRAALVGARIGVFWKLDNTFYRGQLTAFNPSTGKYTIKYDDKQVESLWLEKERVQWYTPRGRSAGCTPQLHSLMLTMGMEGLLPEFPTEQPANAPQGVAPPALDYAAVGWRVSVHSHAAGTWHAGEVLSWDEAKRRHHVLYLDGENEWLDLSQEVLVWHKATRHGAISAGMHTIETMPKARDALGWHVAVYWKDDRTFYPGTVVDYEAATGRHFVAYDDGEQEWLSLRNERIVWRLPPSDTSDGDDEGEVRRSRAARPMRQARKGRFAAPTASDDSWQDADDEELDEEDDDDLDLNDDDDDDDEPPQQRRRVSVSGRDAPHWRNRSRSTSGGPDDKLPGSSDGLLVSPRAAAAGAGAAPLQKRHMVFPSLKKGPMQQLAGAAVGQLLPPSQQLRVTVPGMPALAPLNIGRRSSTTGECVTSPLCRLHSLRSPNLSVSVKVVCSKAPATPSAAAAAAAALVAAGPLKGQLTKLPPEQQRKAAQLQLKLERLSAMMARLSTAAAANGCHLEPLQTAGSAQVATSGTQQQQHSQQHAQQQQQQQQQDGARPTLAVMSLAEGQYVLAAAVGGNGRANVQGLNVAGIGPISVTYMSLPQTQQLQLQGLGSAAPGALQQQQQQQGPAGAAGRTVCVPKSHAIKSCSPNGMGRPLTVRLPGRDPSSSGCTLAGAPGSADAAPNHQPPAHSQASPNTVTPAGSHGEPQQQQSGTGSSAQHDSSATSAVHGSGQQQPAAFAVADKPVICLPGAGAPSPLPMLRGGAVTPAMEGLASPDMEEDAVGVDEFLRQGNFAGAKQPGSSGSGGMVGSEAAMTNAAAAAPAEAAEHVPGQ